MLDADRFKKVNDTYGHPVGDQALVHLAQILTRKIRVTDLVGRYGGEEFMLLLPATTLDGARVIAERIRRTVMNTPVVVEGQSIRLTVSMGVVSNKTEEVQDFESMLKQADGLLYRAKRSGRNRVMTILD
jgi:diguanylate cyclase (GGDEF)-like protein